MIEYGHLRNNSDYITLLKEIIIMARLHKLYYAFTALSLLLVPSNYLQAQSVTGTWYCTIDVMGMPQPLVFHISQDDGAYSTLLDSPAQNVYDIPITDTRVTGDSVMIYAASMHLSLSGLYDTATDEIHARFTQRIIDSEVTLSRDSTIIASPPRPQTPTTWAYRVEDLTFTHPTEGHILSGTLSTPPAGDFDQVVILVSGSGPSDRDQDILGHKTFLVLADHLTRQGIGVLRYDDRGVGQSGGAYSLATTLDLAEDTEGAVNYLKGRYPSKKIGVVGHSEGGLIASIVASKGLPDFIVSLAGPGMDIKDLMMVQSELQLHDQGKTSDEIAAAMSHTDSIYTYLIETADAPVGSISTPLREMVTAAIQDAAPPNATQSYIDGQIYVQMTTLLSPWYRVFMGLKPSTYLAKITCPVLAINGSADSQVVSQNLRIIEEHILSGGNTNVTTKLFDDLNHLFQYDPTGKVSNYGALTETFNIEVMDELSAWILRQ